jgi:hypothetical protein
MTDSCPLGITFGNPVPLSPRGETVFKPHTAYFNNGDYVVIWTEKTQNPAKGPRIEFQLFSGTTNQKISTTPADGVAVYPASPIDPWLRIGTTAVSVYEDYTFLIAWSQLKRSYLPWEIQIKAYKYDVSTQTYSSLTSPLLQAIETSPNKQGKFGFATLSLDNGFVLAHTSQDDKTLSISNYKKQQGSNLYQSQTFIESINNPLFRGDVIVKTVPTQYFYTIVWAPVVMANGIAIQNYRIDNNEKVPGLNVPTISPDIAKPLTIFADLSYRGIISVAWQQFNPNCNAQQYLIYKTQMFSMTVPLSGSFDISFQNSEENLNTYLQQIIMISSNKIMAIYLSTTDYYIEKTYSINGDLISNGANQLAKPVSDNSKLMYAQGRGSPCKKNHFNTQPYDAAASEGTASEAYESSIDITDSDTDDNIVSSTFTIFSTNVIMIAHLETDMTHLTSVINSVKTLIEKVFVYEEGVVSQKTFTYYQEQFMAFIYKNNENPLMYFPESYINNNDDDISIVVDTCTSDNYPFVRDDNYVYICQDVFNTFDFEVQVGVLAEAFFNYKYKLAIYPAMTRDDCITFAITDDHVIREGYLSICLRYFFISSFLVDNDGTEYQYKNVLFNLNMPYFEYTTDVMGIMEQIYANLEAISTIQSYDNLTPDQQHNYIKYLGAINGNPRYEWQYFKDQIASMVHSFDADSTIDYTSISFIPDLPLSSPEDANAAYYVDQNTDAYKGLILLKTIYFDRPENLRKHILLHELTHAWLTTDDEVNQNLGEIFKAGDEIYGEIDCSKWATVHTPVIVGTDHDNIIADCLTFAILGIIG